MAKLQFWCNSIFGNTATADGTKQPSCANMLADNGLGGFDVYPKNILSAVYTTTGVSTATIANWMRGEVVICPSRKEASVIVIGGLSVLTMGQGEATFANIANCVTHYRACISLLKKQGHSVIFVSPMPLLESGGSEPAVVGGSFGQAEGDLDVPHYNSNSQLFHTALAPYLTAMQVPFINLFDYFKDTHPGYASWAAMGAAILVKYDGVGHMNATGSLAAYTYLEPQLRAALKNMQGYYP